MINKRFSSFIFFLIIALMLTTPILAQDGGDHRSSRGGGSSRNNEPSSLQSSECSWCLITTALQNIVVELIGIKNTLISKECKFETVNIEIQGIHMKENPYQAFQFPQESYKEIEIESMTGAVYCPTTTSGTLNTCTYLINNNPCYSVTTDMSTTLSKIHLNECIQYFYEGSNVHHITTSESESSGSFFDLFIKLKIKPANC
jgi:hypothetical protein